jgi:hypothetical protein
MTYNNEDVLYKVENITIIYTNLCCAEAMKSINTDVN